MENVNYISTDKMKSLENSIAWLSNLTPDKDILFVVGNSLNKEDWDIPKTQLLQELIYHNIQRNDILNLLMEKTL